MVSISSTTALAILASLVAAQNPIVVSIANQIVNGIAAAKTDDNVSPADATSELQAVIEVVTKNQDIVGLFSKALPIAMAGLDDKNFPELLSAAGKTLDAFEASPDYAKVSLGLQSALPHYDVNKAMANIQGNLVGVMGIVTPKLPELTPLFPEQWNRATMRVMSLTNDLGLSGNKAKAPAFAIENPSPSVTGDAQPEATGGSDSTVEDDSNTDGSHDDSTVEDDSHQDDSTVEDDSHPSVEDETHEIDDSDVNDTTDKQVVDSEDSTTDGSLVEDDSTVVDDSTVDGSDSSANATLGVTVPEETGIDQANSASAFNVQVAAGAAVMAAFAALI